MCLKLVVFNSTPKSDGCPSGYAGRMGETAFAQRHSKVCAPSKANVNKPANPARTKPNQQFGTELGT